MNRYAYGLLTAILASACTKGYVAPPLAPSDPVSITTPPPAPPGPPVQPFHVTLTIGRSDPTVDAPISFVASTPTLIREAAWSFGNGVTQRTTTGETAYAYPAVGTFDASVTVTATDGRTATAHQPVTVSRRPTPPRPPPPPPPPVPTLDAVLTCTPRPALTPTPCNITVSYGGGTVPSSQVTGVTWDWGDGPPPAFTPGPVSSHVYPQAGSFTVLATVTATTSDGSKTATARTTITIDG